MSLMVSAVCLSLLAAPGLAFVRTPFVAEQVRHAPAQTARSTTSARTSTRMVATPDKVSTGVKRNENFAKLKVSDPMVVCGEEAVGSFVVDQGRVQPPYICSNCNRVCDGPGTFMF